MQPKSAGPRSHDSLQHVSCPEHIGHSLAVSVEQVEICSVFRGLFRTVPSRAATTCGGSLDVDDLSQISNVFPGRSGLVGAVKGVVQPDTLSAARCTGPKISGAP